MRKARSYAMPISAEDVEAINLMNHVKALAKLRNARQSVIFTEMIVKNKLTEWIKSEMAKS